MIVINEAKIKWKGFPEHKKYHVRKLNKSGKSKSPGVLTKPRGDVGAEK